MTPESSNPVPFKPFGSSPVIVQEMKVFWEILEPFYDEVDAEVLKLARMHPEFRVILKAMTAEALKKENEEGRERTRKLFTEGAWEPFLANLGSQGVLYAGQGISFTAWTQLIRDWRRVVLPRLFKACGPDQARLLEALHGMNEFAAITLAGIGEAYLAAKQRVIGQQEAYIRELSTPVLKLGDRLLILPLVGILDSERARLVTQALLQAIRTHRARVVVMDITGVPLVDSKVASHFVQTVEAAGLMGAMVFITGISAEIAQTMVSLGAELPRIRTFAELQDGIEAAQADLAVKPRGE